MVPMSIKQSSLAPHRAAIDRHLVAVVSMDCHHSHALPHSLALFLSFSLLLLSHSLLYSLSPSLTQTLSLSHPHVLPINSSHDQDLSSSSLSEEDHDTLDTSHSLTSHSMASSSSSSSSSSARDEEGNEDTAAPTTLRQVSVGCQQSLYPAITNPTPPPPPSTPLIYRAAAAAAATPEGLEQGMLGCVA